MALMALRRLADWIPQPLQRVIEQARGQARCAIGAEGGDEARLGLAGHGGLGEHDQGGAHR